MPAATLQSALSQEEKIEPVQREASVPGTYVNFDRAEVGPGERRPLAAARPQNPAGP